jgi:hypothetical protein
VKTKRKLLDVVRLLTNNSLARQSEMSEHEPSLVIDYTESREQQTADMRHTEPLDNEMNSSQSLSELQIQRKVQNQKGWSKFSEVFMVSALLGDGMNDIKVTAKFETFIDIYFTVYVEAKSYVLALAPKGQEHISVLYRVP